MTPSTFSTKWLTKFRHLLFHDLYEPTNAGSRSPLWMIRLCQHAFEHLCHFHREGASHAFKYDEFPRQPTNILFDHMPVTSPDALLNIVNPFILAAAIVMLVEGFLTRLEAMKTKDKWIYGIRWEELDLTDRRIVDELIVAVAREREQGRWCISDEQHATVMKSFQDADERGVWAK